MNQLVPLRETASALDELPRTARAEGLRPSELPALIAAGEPVVLTGLFDAWPALACGRSSPEQLNAYLMRLDLGAPAPVMEAPSSSRGRFAYSEDMRELSYSVRQRPVGETLDRIASAGSKGGGPSIAIQMLPLASHMPGFVAQNPAPAAVEGVPPRLWVGGPMQTQTHNDRDHNLACVIAGRRRFLLFPPEQAPNLYVGPVDRPPPLSLVDPLDPDLVRFPRFAEALSAAQIADLRPGDALFLPRYWWHHVTSLAPYNAMVNYWWGSAREDDPNDAFLTALLALRDLPPRERGYWRAMFEAHVFSGGGESVAHIPPDLRGVLGPLSPRARLALRQQLKAARPGGAR